MPDPLFKHLVSASITPPLCLHNLRERSPAPRFRSVQRQKNANVLQLDAGGWQIGGYGELRSVYILSPKVEVVNMFFFPEPAYALPVYALELVVFGQRPVVGVIDLPCLDACNTCHDEAKALLNKAHGHFPLPQAADPPAWYQTCRSGNDFFVRPGNMDEVLQLQAAHAWIWSRVTRQMHPHTPPADDSAAHALAAQTYKRHHRDNSPGLPLLKQHFGNDWAESFLDEFLFANTANPPVRRDCHPGGS